MPSPFLIVCYLVKITRLKILIELYLPLCPRLAFHKMSETEREKKVLASFDLQENQSQCTVVVYFDQLSGAFQPYLVENVPNKIFFPAFGCTQHPKAGQNTQQVGNTSSICVHQMI